MKLIIRYLTILLIIMIISVTSEVSMAIDLEITDSEDRTIYLKNVRIDYTDYPIPSPVPSPAGRLYIYFPDFEHAGIRAYLGEGVVTIKWSVIDSVKILDKNIDQTPYSLNCNVVLKSGKIKTLPLMTDSKEGLVSTVV